MTPVLKRVCDILLSSIGLILLFPVFIIVAVLIKKDSPGPIFYLALRTGQYGKPFQMFKFRTMVLDNERAEFHATARNDPRVTKIGKILRQYKIDELPQLINVVRGEMSIVGPRPEVEEHTRCYSEAEKSILDVLPGITDYASIRFRNLTELLGDEDPDKVYVEKYRDEKNQLRLAYVKDRSFSVDLKILLRTICCILFDK